MEIDRAHYMDLCAMLKKENEVIAEESTRLKTTLEEVMIIVMEVEFEEDQPLEVGISKVKEVVWELRGKIIDLEAIIVPITPPEELERRETKMKAAVSRIIDFEKEFQQLYNDVEQT